MLVVASSSLHGSQDLENRSALAFRRQGLVESRPIQTQLNTEEAQDSD